MYLIICEMGSAWYIWSFVRWVVRHVQRISMLVVIYFNLTSIGCYTGVLFIIIISDAVSFLLVLAIWSLMADITWAIKWSISHLLFLTKKYEFDRYVLGMKYIYTIGTTWECPQRAIELIPHYLPVVPAVYVHLIICKCNFPSCLSKFCFNNILYILQTTLSLIHNFEKTLHSICLLLEYVFSNY